MHQAVTRTSLIVLFTVVATGCGAARTVGDASASEEPLEYVVDLNDRSGDTFKVTLRVDDLGPENDVYQFASTAPGTYQVMDIGRYVRSFEAVDASGTVVASEQISTNQWRISDPDAVVEIRYALADTWDAPVEEHPIYRMAGTSLEDDHALFNNQAVFGYPTGMQARPLRIQIDRPNDWVIGTALGSDDAGRYLAADFDHLVDSPILAGRLSTSSVDVRGTDVDIFTYSITDEVKSDEIMTAVHSILDAAGTYLGELPVDRYAFLFHFEDVTMGALEHSYSSTYALAEYQFDQLISQTIPDIVAHEFLHIVTPLNIHSEVIEQFDFVNPTASEHVWLYEGVTEWMAHTSQLRGGLIDLDTYLGRLSEKLVANEQYDPTFSLSDIGLQSFSERGQQQWGNIYQRGAVVAGLLDIRLLSLSGGERGLREVMLELSDVYGPEEAFDEDAFFDEFVAMTYPELRAFFDGYVRSTEPLPLKETFSLVGVDYIAEEQTGEQDLVLGVQIGAAGDQLVFAAVDGPAEECGLQAGDLFVALEGEDVTPATLQQAIGKLQQLRVDEPFDLTIRRGDEEQTVTCSKRMVDRVERHVLRIAPDASPEQVALRDAWSSRL